MSTAISTPGSRQMRPLFRPFETLRQEFDDLFGRLATDWDGKWLTTEFKAACDLSETADAYQLRMDVPGIKPDDITVQVTGDTVHVSGERTEEKVDATMELDASDSVFMLTNKPRSGLIGISQAPVELIVEHPLLETVRRALRATGYLELRSLRVTVNENGVTLDGRVPSYDLTQLVQSAATRVPGLARFITAVEVGNCR